MSVKLSIGERRTILRQDRFDRLARFLPRDEFRKLRMAELVAGRNVILAEISATRDEEQLVELRRELYDIEKEIEQ